MKKGRILVLLFILAVVVLYVIIYVVPQMRGALEEKTVLKYGSLPVADNTEGLIVRDETLFAAGAEGRLEYEIDESEKVRKGTKIVNLEPANVFKGEKDADGNEKEPESEYGSILSRAGDKLKVSESNVANISGVVSYHVDGYEKILTPKKIKNLNRADFEEINPKVENLRRKKTLKGDPVYKMAKNTLWYLVLWKDKDEDVKNYEDNKTVKINIGKTQIDAKVEGVHKKEDGSLVVLSTDMYYKNYSMYRKIEISVIFAEYQGLIVENDSIMSSGDKREVYVKQKDDSFKPVPVKVLATSGGYSVLSVESFYDEDGKAVDTVNYYEEILTKPEDFKKGNG